MHALDTFIEAMLQEGVLKDKLLRRMLDALENVPEPVFGEAYLFEVDCHGIDYNYKEQSVVIHNIEVENTSSTIVSFQTFQVLLEGVIVCNTKRRW